MVMNARSGMQERAVVIALFLSLSFFSHGDCARLHKGKFYDRFYDRSSVREEEEQSSPAGGVNPANYGSLENPVKGKSVSLTADNVSDVKDKVLKLDALFANQRVHSKNKRVENRTVAEETSGLPFCSPDHDPVDRRVVWYGGTFDPPTVAHMHVAEVALAQEGVNCVWFSPLFHPKYKPDKADIRVREEMILKSIGGNNTASMGLVRAYERSYRSSLPVQRMDYHAYLHLSATYPHTKFDMVIGADSVTHGGSYTVTGWRDILRAINRDENHIFVMDRDVGGEDIRAYEAMVTAKWDISPSPYVNIAVDMDRYSHVSSSGIRSLLLDATDGVIDDELKERLISAGLSNVLVDFLRAHPAIVLRYNNRPTTTTTTFSIATAS